MASFAGSTRGAEKDKDIDSLIAKLVSPNKGPSSLDGEDDGEPPVYPDGYDFKAQKRVLEARDALVAKGTAAFPALIRNIGDRRYSYNYHQDGWYNMDVGAACFRIISIQVEVYRPFVQAGRSHIPRTYWLAFGHEGDVEGWVNKWWKAHEKMSLREIQLEGLKWAIEHERDHGGSRFKQEREAVVGDLETAAPVAGTVKSCDSGQR